MCVCVYRFYYTQLERRGDCGGLDKLPKVGDYCCARYSHDCKWYRARILSVNVKKCDNGKEITGVCMN